MNKVIIAGYLGQDPELRYTGSGTAVANLRVATDESYTDRDGEQVDKTEWHSVVVWGRKAEVINEYLSKGNYILLEGKLQTRSWEDRDGNERYTTEVKLMDFEFGPRVGGDNPTVDQDTADNEPDPGQPEDETFQPDDELPF